MAAGAAYQGRRAAVSGGGAGPAAWACAAAAGGARSRSAALPPHAHCPGGGGGGTERPGARCQCGAGAARRGSLRHRGGNFTSPPVRRTAERGGKPRAVEGRGGESLDSVVEFVFFPPGEEGGKKKTTTQTQTKRKTALFHRKLPLPSAGRASRPGE